MADEKTDSKQKNIADLLVEELKRLEDSGQRHREYTGQTDRAYDSYMREIMEWKLPSHVKVRTAISTIKDAFHCGFNVGPYIATLRAYCSQHTFTPANEQEITSEIARR